MTNLICQHEKFDLQAKCYGLSCIQVRRLRCYLEIGDEESWNSFWRTTIRELPNVVHIRKSEGEMGLRNSW